jgi:hypothetical protein
MEMATLSALKLISAKKSNTASPIQQRRNKLSKKIHQQIELAKAVASGGHYAVRSGPVSLNSPTPMDK